MLFHAPPLWFISTFAMWVVVLRIHLRVLKWNEHRKELRELHDPVLHFLPTRNVSRPISILTFLQVGMLCYYFDFHRLSVAMWTAIPMLLLKCLCVWIVPLRVHRYNIPIFDEFLDRWFLRQKSFRNDLLFSGHLAHALIVANVIPEHRTLLHVNAFAIAALMLLSKTHYTIDLVLAPIAVSYCARFADFALAML